jgi:SAM-dependent methyltransferase
MRDYLVAFYADIGKGVEFEYLQDAHYVLEECRDCGLMYQREVPDLFLLHKLYEEWIDPQTVRKVEARERTARYLLWCGAEIARMIEHLRRAPSEVKFLDFGMGGGNWCLIAKAFGCAAYGTEITERVAEYAVSRGIEHIPWEELAQHKFDFINAEQVFEHLVDPLLVLRRLRQVLAPGGIIRINVPGSHNIKRNLQLGDWLAPEKSPLSLNDVAPLQHLNCFNFESLARMGERADLREVEIPGDFLAPQGMAGNLKAIARPFFHAFFPRLHEARRRLVSNVCFVGS